jgi:hypothetical protein
VGHGGSRPASAVGHDARVWMLYNIEIQPKCYINLKKKRKERRKRRKE